MATRDLLTAAGLDVPDDEIESVVAWIEGSRALASALYAGEALPPPPAAPHGGLRSDRDA